MMGLFYFDDSFEQTKKHELQLAYELSIQFLIYNIN